MNTKPSSNKSGFTDRANSNTLLRTEVQDWLNSSPYGKFPWSFLVGSDLNQTVTEVTLRVINRKKEALIVARARGKSLVRVKAAVEQSVKSIKTELEDRLTQRQKALEDLRSIVSLIK